MQSMALKENGEIYRVIFLKSIYFCFLNYLLNWLCWILAAACRI